MGLVGVALAMLVLAACGGDNEPPVPAATLPRVTTTTNPYAVPFVIDEAYVNRVLAGLNGLIGDAVRLVVRTKLIDEEVFYRFQAAYVGDFLQLQLDHLQRDLFANFPGAREVPGDKKTTVVRLITIEPSCIFAEVSKDFSAVVDRPDSTPSTQWVALVPLEHGKDPANYNPTPWMFIYDGFQEDRSQPPDPCASEP